MWFLSLTKAQTFEKLYVTIIRVGGGGSASHTTATPLHNEGLESFTVHVQLHILPEYCSYQTHHLQKVVQYMTF